jgi:Domain of unknown function (DUF3854)
MTSYPNGGASTLSDPHRRMLYDESGIDPGVAAERGVRTTRGGRELPNGFSRRQRKRGGGLLFTVHRPGGETAYSYRPDAVDPENPGHRYEQPCKHLGARGNVLDVHPSVRDLIDDISTPVIFCEGIKKADSILSAARREGVRVLVVAITGVWNWMSDGEAIADMFDIPVEGRRVTICFDSDMLRNPNVQDAARRFAGHLIGRGAEVFTTYLPDQADGSKMGADDFLAGGGTLAELRMLTRRYDPDDFVRVRLSRSEKLRTAISDLWRDWYERDWMHFVGRAERGNWARGHTARDVKEAFIELAMRRGKQDERGIVVTVGLRTLANMSAKSHESARKAVLHLEEDGQLEIIPAVDGEKPRSYRLLVGRAAARARVDSMRNNTETESCSRDSDPRCQPLRAPSAPRLRWSSPGRGRRKEFELVPGRPVVRSTGRPPKDAQEVSPYIKRLGPHRGAVCDVLEVAGGEMHLEDFCEETNRKRPRDVRRRILAPLEKAGVIELQGDVIRLARDWLGKLEAKRVSDGETEQAERQREKHHKDSERYREHLKRMKRGTPEASKEAARRSREVRKERMEQARQEEERDKAPTPLALEVLIRKILAEHDRMRMGLLCDVAREEGHRWRDVPPAVRRMGYRIEELPEYGGAEFIYTDRKAA